MWPFKKKKKSDPRPRRAAHQPMSRGEIFEKVLAKEQERDYHNRCLKMHVCPACGDDLEIDYDDEHDLDDGICRTCNITYPI